jgi:integrase
MMGRGKRIAACQWFFPARTLTFVPEDAEHRRYHLHESHVQKALRKATRQTVVGKRVTAHTFSHSFSVICSRQTMTSAPFRNSRDTAIYRPRRSIPHTVPDTTKKQAMSPLDF